MNKKFAIVMALFMTLAGCTESVEEEIKEIIEIPGCNDDTAFNFDENATNADACLTELALEQAIMNFMTTIEQGPTDANSTMGLTVASTSSDGMNSNTEMAFSPSGFALFISMSGDIDMGGMTMPLSYMSEQTTIPNPDGSNTTIIHMVYMEESQEFTMHNNVPWSVIVAEMLEDDDHDDEHSDDMDGDHDGEDHGDDGMDMDMDMDIEPADPEDLLSGFDVANSTYALALATDEGYSFTASMTETVDGMNVTTSFTFVLNSNFEVTSVSATDGMDTMTVTLLSDAEVAGYFDADWSSIATEALPFVVMPMDGGHDDHDDDHGDHDDHGDDGDHDDHGDDDHGDHGDHDDHGEDHGDDPRNDDHVGDHMEIPFSHDH